MGKVGDLSPLVGDDRVHAWNKLGDLVGKKVEPLVHDKIKPILLAHKKLATAKGSFAGITFSGRVTLDIEMACLEQEYSHLVEPGFHQIVAEWYVRGHFPCGWEGRFPKGKLVIF